MCGINGIALSSNSRRSLDVGELERMRDVLTHRGPDDAGIFVDARAGRVGLGHRRLSIVDVASGHQPMTNEDRSLYITYNGEIYNHADFRSALEARGHVYGSRTDSETIMHLYEERGLDYPIGYVRWTAKRNMQAFLELIAQRIGRYAKLVGRENVIAGSDCGFATFAGSRLSSGRDGSS